MKTQRLAIILAAANLILLAFLLARLSHAQTQAAAPVLRAHALEIVDEQGRVRASIKVQPPDPAVRRPDGSLHAETVMLRLIDPHGRPAVKIGASVDGAGLGLLGRTDNVGALLKAEGADSVLRLSNGDGKQLQFAP
jgi:hypothetical protein